MSSESHSLVLTKLAQRQLGTDVINKHMNGLTASVNNRSLYIAGWEVVPDRWDVVDYHGGVDNYQYLMYLTVKFSHQSSEPDKRVLNSIAKNIFTRAAQPKLGRWELSLMDGKPYEPPDENNTTLSENFIGYTDIEFPDDWDAYFSHLYGLDSPVKRLRRAIEAGMKSNWANRFHAALIGPPGCGKSDVCASIKRALGEEAVAEYDATATTSAGVIKDLAEREILPRILVIEEIEKSDERQLAPYLAIMDQRSEIRKTTARSSIQRDTKLFCIATVNDENSFRHLQKGALYSRFSNRIRFNRPNRDQLGMILQREIVKVEGDFAWVTPTLDYCEKYSITDPREVTSICLCGAELLITGEYQQMLIDTGAHVNVFNEGYGLVADDMIEDWTEDESGVEQ